MPLAPENLLKLAAHLQDKYDNTNASSTSYVGGLQTLYNSLNTQITHDLAKAESSAIALNIIMLLIIFGTAVSAGLPMVVALGSITGSFLVIYLITRVADVSVFALNLLTGLGLGLGIDYALLIVNRFREELVARYLGHACDQGYASTTRGHSGHAHFVRHYLHAGTQC